MMSVTNLGGRKVTMTLILLVVGVTVTALLNDIPPNLLVFLQTVFAAYVVGNVGEHIAKNRTGDKSSLEQVVADNRELAERNEQVAQDLQAQLLVVSQGVQASNQALAQIMEWATNGRK